MREINGMGYYQIHMIVRGFRNMLKMVDRNSFGYVCHKELKTIKDKYGQTKTQKAKMWTHMFQHRITTGFRQMKHDLLRYHTLRKLPHPTKQQLQQRDRIYIDLKKLLPVFFIQAMPMTPILFLAYMKYFPDSVPSWFQVDEDYFTRRKHYAMRMIEAASQLEKAQVEFNSCNVQELKLLATALTGKAVDGTNILSQVLNKKVSWEGGVMGSISEKLLRRQITKTIENDPALKHHSEKSIDQKIAIKLGARMMLAPTTEPQLLTNAEAQTKKLEDKSGNNPPN